MRALIIEDEPRIAEMIEEELALLGYDSVDVARTQEEAIAAADGNCPDIITADDRLVEGSGIAAVEHICRSKVIPVVFLLGDPDLPDGLLPYAYLAAKPFTMDVLRSAVMAAVRQARNHAALVG
jgi:two-component system, response regulator PdtaR